MDEQRDRVACHVFEVDHDALGVGLVHRLATVLDVEPITQLVGAHHRGHTHDHCCQVENALYPMAQTQTSGTDRWATMQGVDRIHRDSSIKRHKGQFAVGQTTTAYHCSPSALMRPVENVYFQLTLCK